MAVSTTCIGAYPKPDYVPIRDWFQEGHNSPDYNDKVLHAWDQGQSDEGQRLMDQATAEAVADQIACGINVPTDGEIRRDNYVHYQCRHFDGFDFKNLTHVSLRNGAYEAELPTIRGPVRHTGKPILVRDWQVAQRAAGNRPVKITLPGPMTIADTTADTYYRDPAVKAEELATALNAEIAALADAGCKHIQIDEPIFARKPAQALDFGIAALERCFEDLEPEVTRIVHICCGYPNKLDDEDYPKANPKAYLDIARAIDGSFEQISIEDAHRHNPAELFERFERATLIVGFVRVASSRLESVAEIKRRLDEVLCHLPDERLIAAPDCGLGFLGRELAMAKLRNLCAAVGV